MLIKSSGNRDHDKRIDRQNSCYQLDLIMRIINHERSFGRPLETIYLSNYHYAKLEAFLCKKNIRTEINQYAPLYLKKVEILPANRNIGDKDFEIKYYSKFDPNRMENLEKNIANLGLDNMKVIDNVFNDIKRAENLCRNQYEANFKNRSDLN